MNGVPTSAPAVNSTMSDTLLLHPSPEYCGNTLRNVPENTSMSTSVANQVVGGEACTPFPCSAWMGQ